MLAVDIRKVGKVSVDWLSKVPSQICTFIDRLGGFMYIENPDTSIGAGFTKVAQREHETAPGKKTCRSASPQIIKIKDVRTQTVELNQSPAETRL